MRDKSIKTLSRLGLGVVSLGVFSVIQAESIPADSPRWQLEHKAKVTEYLGRRLSRRRPFRSLLARRRRLATIGSVDTMVVVDPATFAARLEVASFGEVHV